MVLALKPNMDDIENRLTRLKLNVGQLNQDMHQQKEDIRSLNETVKVYNEELVLVSTKTDTVQTTLVSVDNQRNQEFNSLQTQIGSTISSELTTLDSKLNSMSTSIASDFNGVSTDLNGISDDISNKIDDHAALTAAKLTNIEELLSEGVGPYTCGGTGGWRRAVYLDMTDLTTNCPSGWALTKRTCGRSTDGQGTCDSAYFPVIGGGYSAVCGMIKAYICIRSASWFLWVLLWFSPTNGSVLLQWSGRDARKPSTAHLDFCCRKSREFGHKRRLSL